MKNTFESNSKMQMMVNEDFILDMMYQNSESDTIILKHYVRCTVLLKIYLCIFYPGILSLIILTRQSYAHNIKFHNDWIVCLTFTAGLFSNVCYFVYTIYVLRTRCPYCGTINNRDTINNSDTIVRNLRDIHNDKKFMKFDKKIMIFIMISKVNYLVCFIVGNYTKFFEHYEFLSYIMFSGTFMIFDIVPCLILNIVHHIFAVCCIYKNAT